MTDTAIQLAIGLCVTAIGIIGIFTSDGGNEC